MTRALRFDFAAKRMRHVFAVEAAECGLACLTMVANCFGNHVTLDELRRAFPVTLAGSSLRALIDIASNLDMDARAIRVEPVVLKHLAFPAILHWNMDHFVVLAGYAGNRAIIYDPARGVSKVDPETLSNAFSGVALELSRRPEFRKTRPTRGLKISDLWVRSEGLTGSALQLFALSLALQCLAFLVPLQMQMTIDQGVFAGDRGVVNALAASFTALAIVHVIVAAGRAWMLQVVSTSFSYQMVGNVVSHLLRLRVDYFEKRHVGDILSRVSSTRTIQDTITQGVIVAFIDGLMAIAALAVMLSYSVPLTAVVVTTALLCSIVAAVSYGAMRERTSLQLAASAREQSHIMETIRSAAIIKLMGKESDRESSWKNLFASSLMHALSVSKVVILSEAAQQLMRGLQMVCLVWLGAVFVIGRPEAFTLGMLIAFLSFAQTFTDRVTSLVTEAVKFRLLGLHLERVSDIVGADPDKVPAADPPDVLGQISLRNVSHSYGVGLKEVVGDVSVDIHPGEFVAIVGPSGSGKTTLLKIILGLVVPQSGDIVLDEVVATQDVFVNWRRRVSVVSQDDRLLSGTLEENITFFDAAADIAHVRSVAAQAGILDDILAMPLQFNSLVGDMGSALSGGQKQRLLLARALYRRPSVLILDEGTANLDIETENRIGDMLGRLPITRIVVAHRPALVERADRVLEMRGGALTERHAAVLHVG